MNPWMAGWFIYSQLFIFDLKHPAIPSRKGSILTSGNSHFGNLSVRGDYLKREPFLCQFFKELKMRNSVTTSGKTTGTDKKRKKIKTWYELNLFFNERRFKKKLLCALTPVFGLLDLKVGTVAHAPAHTGLRGTLKAAHLAADNTVAVWSDFCVGFQVSSVANTRPHA